MLACGTVLLDGRGQRVFCLAVEWAFTVIRSGCGCGEDVRPAKVTIHGRFTG